MRYASRERFPPIFHAARRTFSGGPEPDMSLLPDDEQERNLPGGAIPLDEEFLPALSGHDALVNPARAYLLSLNSPRSRQTMASFLGIVAGMLGAPSSDLCSWGSLRRHHVMAVTELLLSRAWRRKPGCSG